MDVMTTRICAQGVGSLGYARVLVNANAKKGLDDSIDVLYKNKKNEEKFVKKVRVEYDWKPPVCQQCGVFGHTENKCHKNLKTQLKIKVDDNDAEGFTKVENRKEKYNEGRKKYVNKFAENKYGNQKFIYRKKINTVADKEDVSSNKCTNKESLNTPSQTMKKIWNVRDNVIKDIKSTVNKFSVLQELEKYHIRIKLSNKEKDEVEKYLMMDLQPSVSATNKWSKEMIEFFKEKRKEHYRKDNSHVIEDTDGETDIELDENDVFIDRSGTAKFMTDNEVSGLVLETHMKKDRIDKVGMNIFGSWSWQNNVNLSRKGCRIAVGWDSNSVNCSLMNATEQSMLYHVEVIAGDVNVSLKLEDHSEGMSNFTQDMIDFQNCVNDVEIEDISCTGVHFTWTKSLLNPNSKILKKIDRVMSNCEFITKFSNANVVFLPFGISDHSPAILKIPQVMVKKNKSFRLANYITNKMEFRELVKEKWEVNINGHSMYMMVKKLKGLKPHLNKLNWSNGNLFKKAAELKEKVNEVQGKIDKDPTNKELREEGADILKNYIEAAEDEEKLLMQKAKVNWLKEEDKNTAYFHKVLKGRLNRSRILSICAEDGTRFENYEVANQIIKHFEGFLRISPSNVSLTNDDNELFEKQIPLDKAKLMIKDVTEEEIKKALFDIDDNKAPGPDGFTSKFFKKSWDISAFVPGRAITDNILLTQELLKGYDCAYDTICWRFIKDILRRFGFPERMVMRIMTCVASTKFTICVNGERYGYFKGVEVSSKFKITYLCFADDLIMLSHGDMSSVATLKRALDKFSSISGLYPHLSKCTMFCGSLDDDTKEAISSIFPFKEGKLLVRYLGVPLVTKKIGIAECNQLVEKVRQKLSDWKNKSLSYAGRA
ncbi:RNA-directed DNA polymerase, eukaryota, reverse transcriptase zinc-binding domain protein [Tanacetum coccineum]